MGRQAGRQNRLFYSFNLEDGVPPDHLLRRINRCLDFGGLHHHVAGHCSQIGRPSADPELTLRMLVIGYGYLQALDANELGVTSHKKQSLTDPMASWTAATHGPAFYACVTNDLVDVEHGIILGLQAKQVSRTVEAASAMQMIEHVQQQHGLRPQRLIGDTDHGTAPMLAWVVEQGIEPHMPVWDRTQRADLTVPTHLRRPWPRLRRPEAASLKGPWPPPRNPAVEDTRRQAAGMPLRHEARLGTLPAYPSGSPSCKP